jgi:hypothetical protein
MPARLLLGERRIAADGRFAGIVIWHLPSQVPESGNRLT